MLEIDRVTKSFADKVVLRGVSLGVEEGEVVVLLGPSGCGKTTLLRIIAGLEVVDGGRVCWEGKDLSQVAVHERGFGFVFQDYALFPHRTVGENVAFGLRMLGWEKGAIEERVMTVLSLVDMSEKKERDVTDLSGGEQQRVALARSLAPRPSLLLLDEPLGALDRALRERLLLELQKLLQVEGGVTAVYVTHDQAEAFALGDQIVVMNEGRVEQMGTPMDLYQHPATAFVARFLGMENVVKAKVGTDGALVGEWGMWYGAEADMSEGEWITFLVRPEAASWGEALAESNILRGEVVSVSFRGRYLVVGIVGAGQVWQFEWEVGMGVPAVGEKIRLGIRAEGIIRLNDGNG
ncbi:MAG TPA: ABC transporter ATP-binding protein [Anaerolineae bacterium]|nr:ABC transporter ATP-binding protein [Anaerolineae bacterium]